MVSVDGMKAAVWPVLGAATTVAIDEQSFIGLGAAAGVVVALVVVTQRWTRIEAKVEKIDQMEGKINEIHEQMSGLDCVRKNGKCHEK